VTEEGVARTKDYLVEKNSLDDMVSLCYLPANQAL